VANAGSNRAGFFAIEIGIDADSACQAFSTYRPDGYTSKMAIKNLVEKLGDANFLSDVDTLVSAEKSGYNVEEAAALIIEKYLIKL